MSHQQGLRWGGRGAADINHAVLCCVIRREPCGSQCTGEISQAWNITESATHFSSELASSLLIRKGWALAGGLVTWDQGELGFGQTGQGWQLGHCHREEDRPRRRESIKWEESALGVLSVKAITPSYVHGCNSPAHVHRVTKWDGVAQAVAMGCAAPLPVCCDAQGTPRVLLPCLQLRNSF